LESSAFSRASNPGRPSPLAPSSPGSGRVNRRRRLFRLHACCLLPCHWVSHAGERTCVAISPPAVILCGGMRILVDMGIGAVGDSYPSRVAMRRHGRISKSKVELLLGVSWRRRIRKVSDTYTPPAGRLPWSVISPLCNTTIPASPRITISAVSRLPGTMAPATAFFTLLRSGFHCRLPCSTPTDSPALLPCPNPPLHLLHLVPHHKNLFSFHTINHLRV
jgi:hypothetical protein